jgi:hypothetical protein
MKNAFILIIIALTLSAMACSPKTAETTKAPAEKGIGMDMVTKTFGMLVTATNEGDIDKVLDFTYPKMFDLQPKEQIKQMHSQMSMMGIKQMIQNTKITDLSKFVTSEGSTMQFAKAKLAATSKVEVADKSLVDMLYTQMKGQFDESKMTKNEDGVSIDVEEDLYIINDPETKKMYFVQAGAQIKPMLGQILPADVVEKLK